MAAWTGEIVGAGAPGWWIVRDDSGKKHRVASSDFFRRGQRVSVVGGLIIDHAGVKKETVRCLV